MNPQDLPLLGSIKNWDFGYVERFSNLDGKRVLCIGYSESEIDRLVAPLGATSIEVLTLWPDHIDSNEGRYRVHIGDITRRTHFSDNEFDVVLTLSLLEHLDPLEDALLEMRRITKPGGENCHMFGPAWSSAYGSHLFMRRDDPMLAFSQWRMPAFIHLLCSPREIRNFYLKSGYDEKTSDHVIFDMFSNTFINRVFYDNYIRFMSTHFIIENAELMTVDVPQDLVRKLRSKFPWNIDYSTYGGKYQLRKIV